MISCIILAGGESKRFGEDKGFFNFQGISFIERSLDTAMEISDDIVICGRDESKIRYYRAEAENAVKKRLKAGKRNLMPEVIVDDKNCAFKGPLRGIYSAIKKIKGKFFLVMECDAPFFNAEAAKALINKAKSEKVDAVIPLWPDSTVEPLLAFYKRKQTLDIIDMLHDYALNLKEYFLFNDSVNISRFLPSVYYYNIPDMVKANKNFKAADFININSKKELETKMQDKKIFRKGGAKSIKIKKKNTFYYLKNPQKKPYGILAKALYYWWVYSKTKNHVYLIKSFELFKKDSDLYHGNGLDFMGDKIIKLLPDPYNIHII